MLKWRGLCLAMLTCATVVALALTSLSRWQASSERRLVARWRSAIALLDEPAAAAFIASLRQHDRMAIAPLIEAMADTRPEVSRAAQETVGSLVADWRLLRAHEAVPRLTMLADHLADHYDGFSAAQQRFSRQVAQWMLIWPLEDADFPTDDLVAHCERILAQPAPRFAEADVIPLPPANQGPSEESLPPIVSAELASRGERRQVRPIVESPEQEPAPVLQPPVLSAVEGDEKEPLLGDEPAAPISEPRPIEPRQFIQPRVPQIPPPDQP
jgi:hypothetical protein